MGSRRAWRTAGATILAAAVFGCGGGGPIEDPAPERKEEKVRNQDPSRDLGKLDLLAGVERRTLANGMNVFVKEDRRLPVVTVVTSYRVGSVHEPAGTSGLAHFLEHMLFKGTDKYAKGEIDRITVRAGGSNNAFTDNDFTQYWFAVASDSLDDVLRIEASRMRNSTLDQKEFDEERKVVTEELYRLLDGPWGKVHYELDQVVFKTHSYRRPGWGFEEDLKSVKHETMKEFYLRHYGPNNAALVVVGDINRAKVFDRVQELFGSIAKVEPAVPPTPAEAPQKEERRLDIPSEMSFNRIGMAFRSARMGSEEDFTLDVIQQMLAGGKDARLFKRLVVGDRSALTTEAMNNGRRYDGVFYVFVEVAEEADPAAVEKAVLEELDRLKSKPVEERELRKAKNILTAGFVFSKETGESLAGEIATREAMAVPGYLREYLSRIEAVTPAKIQAVASSVFRPENRSVAVSRARKELRPRALSLGQSAAAELGEVHEHRLPNGMTLLVKPRRDLPIVAMSAFVDAGQTWEPAAKAGVAALVGRLLDQGIERPDGRQKTAEQIAEEVEYTGMQLSTSAEGVEIKTLTRDAAMAFDSLRDLLLHPSFPKEKVELYRQHQLDEIQSVGDSPKEMCQEMFAKQVYAGHPLERPANGLMETVQKLTREDVVAHYRATFRPDATILAVVGDVDPAAVLREVQKRFAGWKAAEAGPAPVLPVPKAQDKPCTVVEFRKTNQVNTAFGHLSIPHTHPDFHALRVLEHIFCRSTGFVDRLSRVVREEMHLAYEVWGRATHLDDEPPAFMVYIGSAAGNGSRARDAALRILDELLRDGPTPDELEVAKGYLMRSVPFSWDSNEDLARYLITLRRLKLGMDWPARYREGIAAVTREDVLRAGQAHLTPGRLTTVIVGPVDAEGRVVAGEDKNGEDGK